MSGERFEEEVRAMLVRRAADVSVGEAEWQRLVARLDGAGMAGDGAVGGRRRGPWLLAVAALLAVVVGALALVARDDGEDRAVRVLTAPPTVPTPIPSPEGDPVMAIYPATAMRALQVLERDAAEGRRPDLADPRALAREYVRSRVGHVVEVAISEFRQGDASGGEVDYRVPAEGEGSSFGTISLRRLGALWYVVGSNAGSVAVHMAGYDGVSVRAEIQVLAGGRLEVTAETFPDGEVHVLQEETAVQRGRRFEVTGGTPGASSAALHVRFTGPDGMVQFGDYLLQVPGIG